MSSYCNNLEENSSVGDLAESQTVGSEDTSIQSLTVGSEDASREGARNVVHLYCQPCKYRYHTQEHVYGYCQDCAEHLCRTCYRNHLMPAPSRNHVLLDITQMPKRQNSKLSSIRACEQHNDKAIEFLCKDCNVLGCSICTIDYHRECEIVHIKDVANNSVTGDEYESLLQKLDCLMNRCKKVNKAATKYVTNVDTRRERTRREIQAFRQKIQEQVKQLEKVLEQENNELHDEEKVRAVSVENSSREILEKAEALQSNLLTMLEQTAGNNSILYIQVKKDELVLNDLEKEVKEMEKNLDVKEYQFNPNTDTSLTLNSEDGLGNISCKTPEIRHRFSKRQHKPKILKTDS